ncbi:MAG TPA: hypothetical protein VEI97_13300 [bacterium]|nr:hypothetical protein [bacterium]
MVRHWLIGAVLLLVGAPARAADPVKPFEPKGVAADFVAGLPGAREAYQLEVLARDVVGAVQAYYAHSGAVPRSLADFEETSLLPYRAIDATGVPLPYVPLGDAELPPLGAIGVEVRQDSVRLVVMGAEGDPLSPLVKVVQMPKAMITVPVTASMEARRAEALATGVHARLRAYYDCHGAFPGSFDTVLGYLGWAPHNHRMVSSLAGQPGVAVGFDATTGAVRMDLTPNRSGVPRYEWLGAPARQNWAGPNTSNRWSHQRFVAGLAGSYEPFVAMALTASGAGPAPAPRMPLTFYLNPASGYGWTWRMMESADIGYAAAILARKPSQGSVAEAIRATRAVLEVPRMPDGSALPWRTIEKDLVVSKDPQAGLDYAAMARLEALEPGLYVWFDGTQAGYHLRYPGGYGASTGSGRMASVGSTPAAQLRQEIERLLRQAPSPPPELLQTALVAKLLGESDGVAELRLNLFLEHFESTLRHYTGDTCELPRSWDDYLALRGVVPLGYDPQPHRVQRKLGQQAFTIEVDSTGLFARMVVEPDLPIRGTYHFGLRGGDVDALSSYLDAIDPHLYPEVMDLQYRVIMSTLVPSD